MATQNNRQLHEYLTLGLEERRQAILEDFPAMKTVEEKLLAIGGMRIAFLPDHHAEKLANAGKFLPTSFRVKGERGEPNRCHSNVARLWLKRRAKEFKIWVGWTLHDDGVWRQHTWGVQGRTIVETTTKDRRYFGVELGDDESVLFCVNVLGDGGPEVFVDHPDLLPVLQRVLTKICAK